jgi:hypothetical protein
MNKDVLIINIDKEANIFEIGIMNIVVFHSSEVEIVLCVYDFKYQFISIFKYFFFSSHRRCNRLKYDCNFNWLIDKATKPDLRIYTVQYM